MKHMQQFSMGDKTNDLSLSLSTSYNIESIPNFAGRTLSNTPSSLKQVCNMYLLVYHQLVKIIFNS